jgi:hypothetical protein
MSFMTSTSGIEYPVFTHVVGGRGKGGVSCFQGHLNKCPLGDLNKSPWENYLEGGRREEIIKSTRFCKVHYVLGFSHIKIMKPMCHIKNSCIGNFLVQRA